MSVESPEIEAPEALPVLEVPATLAEMIAQLADRVEHIVNFMIDQENRIRAMELALANHSRALDTMLRPDVTIDEVI